MKGIGGFVLIAFALLPAHPARGQKGAPDAPVERVEIQNNQYLQRETLLFYVSSGSHPETSPYNPGP